MKNFVTGCKDLQILRDESGQDLIEYALVAGLIGLAAVISIKGLSTKLVSSIQLGSAYINVIFPH
jgi:pilus assembly protein Flp/PilA